MKRKTREERLLEEEFKRLDATMPPMWQQSMLALGTRAKVAGRSNLASWCIGRVALYEEQSGHYDRAGVLWHQLLRGCPDDALALLGIARVHFHHGRHDSGTDSLQRIIASRNAPHELRLIASEMLKRLHGYVGGSLRSSIEQYSKEDAGTLYEILLDSEELAMRDPAAAERLVRRLRRRASTLGDDEAVRLCDFHLAVNIVREPHRRIALCRNVLRKELHVRGQANILAALACAERDIGWQKAALRHRRRALELAERDPYCEPTRQLLSGGGWDNPEQD